MSKQEVDLRKCKVLDPKGKNDYLTHWLFVLLFGLGSRALCKSNDRHGLRVVSVPPSICLLSIQIPLIILTSLTFRMYLV